MAGLLKLLAQGNIAKMQVEPAFPVSYHLPVADQLVHMNPLIGERIGLKFSGRINCIHCGSVTRKSFNQGFCYPCATTLAQCDSCITSPERCHYAAGTCREPEWGEFHCMTDHIVYLANSSGLKVGITRASQVPVRWIDQGAVQALPVLRVKNRQISGLVEVMFKPHVADKTNWRAMLQNKVGVEDLQAERDRLFGLVEPELSALIGQYGTQALIKTDDQPITTIEYPVLAYPVRIDAYNLDKTPEISGRLMGIKGQYLMLDGGVINLRKYAGYFLEVYSG